MEEQVQLSKSKILVIGAGGLGSPVLLYLAAAGIGTIGIVEYDTVDLSNLQRQILYNTDDIGAPKLDRAIEHLSKINPNTTYIGHPVAITRINALDIISRYDIVIDGSDNFPTRYLVNDACVLSDKPLVYGSVLRFEGQVSVFNHMLCDGTRSPNYRDIYPTPPPPDVVPNCAEAGVLGVLPGIIGSMQASEAIKLAANVGEPLAGRLWIFDALRFEARTLAYRKNPDVVIDQLIDYERFCGIKKVEQGYLSPQEALEMAARNPNIQIIDVREEYEYQLDHLEGINLPLTELQDLLGEINPSRMTIVHCQSGKRSNQAIRIIKNEYPSIEIFDIKGGIKAWRKTIGRANFPIT